MCEGLVSSVYDGLTHSNNKTVHGFALNYIGGIPPQLNLCTAVEKHVLGINTSQSWHIALAPYFIYKLEKFLMASTVSKNHEFPLNISVNVQNKALKVENGAIVARCLPSASSS